MKKRVLTCLMIIALCVSLLSGGALAETAPDWTGYTAISTPAQLDAIRDNPAGKYYLTQDIVFEQADFEPGGAFYNGGKGWEPIRSFTGVLDGNGHAVVYLYSVRPGEDVGLFWGNGGTIRSLTLFSAYLSGKTVGGIAVSNGGEIHLCSNYFSQLVDVEENGGGIVAANLENGTISYCTTHAFIESENGGTTLGGIAALSSGEVVGCVSQGYALNSRTDDTEAGGIVGAALGGFIGRCMNLAGLAGSGAGGIVSLANNVIVDSCSNAGDVLGVNWSGGIVGAAENTSIEDCFNAGELMEVSDFSCVIGGLVGYAVSDVTIHRCYSVGIVPDNQLTGGLVGMYSADKGMPTLSYCYAQDTAPLCGLGQTLTGTGLGTRTWEQMRQQSAYVGFDFRSVWTMDNTAGYGYPQLRDNYVLGYAGGDVNGDGRTTVSDVRLALRAAVGKVTLAGQQKQQADYNNDDKITVSDVRSILRIAVGKQSARYYWAT